jgi:hypothetical protein
VADLLLPNQADSASDIGVSQGKFRQQIASAVSAIRGIAGAGNFDPAVGVALAQRLLTSQFILYVDPITGRDTYRSGYHNREAGLLNQQLECGYSPFAPFRSLSRALIEVARISFVTGPDNDIYDRVVISVANGEHIADNRPSVGLPGVTPWEDGQEPTLDELAAFNSLASAGLILPRGVSVLGLDLRKTVVRPTYVPSTADSPATGRGAIFRTTGGGFFFTFTFKDNLSVKRSHHMLHCFEFCSDADLRQYYSKVVQAFSKAEGLEVMPGETEIVAPYPDAPTPDTDTTTGSSSYVFSCSLRSDYGLCGAYLDGDEVTGFKSMVTAQFTQVSLQRDMNAWQVYGSGNWRGVANYDEYIASDINNIRYRVDGAFDAKTGTHEIDWRNFGFKVINDAIIQEVSCFVIGDAVHHWTASGGECTITNSNSNFGMTALLSSGFRGISTSRGAFPQDRGFAGVAVRRALQVPQEGNNIARLNLGRVASYDTATGILTLENPLDPAIALGAYTLRPDTYLWVDNVSRETGPGFVPGDLPNSTALPARAKLAPEPWDPARPNEIRLVAASSNINTISAEEIVANRVFIRRLSDTRSPEQREVSMIVQSSATSRRPLGNYILRLSNRTSVADQLDPTNGAGQLFLVTTSDAIQVPGLVGTVPNWKLVLRSGDSVRAFVPGTYYPLGEPVFVSNRIQRTRRSGVFNSFDKAEFEPTLPMLSGQRGVDAGRTTIAPRLIIDADYSPDPDSVTLDVDLLTEPLVQAQVTASGDYAAMRGFMQAVGYTSSDITTILQAQVEDDDRWWRPDAPGSAIPNGLLRARDVWPLEFNRPSLVRAFGHAYEWSGQGNYTKAMPKFQTSVLSDQHKVDFFGVSHSGGRVYNTGFNEDGLIIQGNTIRDLASNRDLSTEIAGIGGLEGDQATLRAFPTEFENLTVTKSLVSSGDTNLNNVELIGKISGSPQWDDGTLPNASRTSRGVIRIATDAEASQFAVDDAAITPASMITALSSAVKNVVNLRIALQNNNPFPDLNTVDSGQLWLHPYKGSEVALWSTTLRRWTVVSFPATPQGFSLAPCNRATTNYDVYIGNTGTVAEPTIALTFVEWNGDSPPNRRTLDGVLVNISDSSRRYIGVVRTSTAGRSTTRLGGVIPASQSGLYPIISVSNLYNRATSSMRFFFGTSWNQTSEPWASPPFYAEKPRCEFVLAERTLATAFLDIYSNQVGNEPIGIVYVAPGIDSFVSPPNDAFYGESQGPNQTSGSQWARTLPEGIHRIYYLYKQFNGPNIVNEHPAHGMIITVEA